MPRAELGAEDREGGVARFPHPDRVQRALDEHHPRGRVSAYQRAPVKVLALSEIGSGAKSVMTLRTVNPAAGYPPRMTILRSRSSLARPYIWHLRTFTLFTLPSTAPELCGNVRPLSTAA